MKLSGVHAQIEEIVRDLKKREAEFSRRISGYEFEADRISALNVSLLNRATAAEAELRAVRERTIDECAKAADGEHLECYGKPYASDEDQAYDRGVSDTVTAIRALAKLEQVKP